MTDNKKALVFSIVIHLFIISLGFLVYYEVTPEKIFRQIEILEFRMEHSPTARFSDFSPVPRIGDSGVRDFNQGQASNIIPQRVELPQVRTELDEPLEKIDIPIEKNIATTPVKLDERIGNTISRVESRIAQDAIDLSANQIHEQPIALTGDDYLESLQALLGERDDRTSAYYLEGEIKQRSILNEVIPDYPEGLDRNATVAIEFNVYPNGRVGDLIIVKKDEPILEELSLNSLSQWRFNPIPQNVVQKGKITFIYRIK